MFRHVVLLTALLFTQLVSAGESESSYPLAIRYWGDSKLTIESFTQTTEHEKLYDVTPLPKGVWYVPSNTAAPASRYLESPPQVDSTKLQAIMIHAESGAELVDRLIEIAPQHVLLLCRSAKVADETKKELMHYLDQINLVHVTGNTFAYRYTKQAEWKKTTFVLLGSESWKPNAELAKLLVRMEKSCSASQEVFKPLSAKQMNFKPSNGTHTPRWNPEHMMGRQLLFFSEIFAAVDPTFEKVDLNPKQMPKDYVAAHPDWTGAQEAEQMERVSQYVRRFAYLLDGIDLDERAPGSRWTLRGLMLQMERHFTEHTENVKKKFDLPDWPAE